MKEADVLKGVTNKLKTLELTGDILWYSRLNSGKINLGRNWIKLCDSGTPDVIAIVKKKAGISVLFIECKRTGINEIFGEQLEFFKRMKEHKHVYCVIINDPKQLWPAIEKAQK
jgi:hypothetical protein